MNRTGIYELDGSEGRENFHGVAVRLELPVIAIDEDFAMPEMQPDAWGIIREDDIPSLCGMRDCTCGCAVRMECIPDWVPIPAGYDRSTSLMMPVSLAD